MENVIYRYWLLLLFSIILSNCNDNSSKMRNNNKIDHLVLDAVGIEIFTPIQIDCDKFVTSFGEEIDQLIIKDKATIQHLLSNLDKQKKAKLDGFGVDTRAKLTVYLSGNLNKPDSEYCIGLLTFSQNGECYKMSDTLREIIRKINKHKDNL